MAHVIPILPHSDSDCGVTIPPYQTHNLGYTCLDLQDHFVQYVLVMWIQDLCRMKVAHDNLRSLIGLALICIQTWDLFWSNRWSNLCLGADLWQINSILIKLKALDVPFLNWCKNSINFHGFMTNPPRCAIRVVCYVQSLKIGVCDFIVVKQWLQPHCDVCPMSFKQHSTMSLCSF